MPSSGFGERESLVRRIARARARYRGPFTAAHIRQALEERGYTAIGEEGEFLEFQKNGCRGIPVNPEWDSIWEDDPIFNCIRRDLGLGKRELLEALNRAKR